MTSANDFTGVSILCASNAVDFLERAAECTEIAQAKELIEQARSQLNTLLVAASKVVKQPE